MRRIQVISRWSQIGSGRRPENCGAWDMHVRCPTRAGVLPGLPAGGAATRNPGPSWWVSSIGVERAQMHPGEVADDPRFLWDSKLPDKKVRKATSY